MKNLNVFQKLFGHLSTVHHHRKLVRQHCFECGLYYQGITHDLSKYSPSELIPSVKYYQGYRSPYMKEKEEIGYSLGWLHHKGHNKHHWEYWFDTINGVWGPVKMPYRYVIESVCDRVAACETYHKENYRSKDALEYYLSKKESARIHPETAHQLERILTMIRDHGESYTFAKIKQSLKNGYEI